MFSLSLLQHATNLVELTNLEDTAVVASDPAHYPTVLSATLTILAPNRSAIAGANAMPVQVVGGTSGAAAIYRVVLPASLPLPLGICPGILKVVVAADVNEREFTGTFTVTAG